MVMESLRGFESRVQYNMVGHSGDGPEFPLVEMGKPPVNAKERLRVLQKMRAHASTCDTGDCTLEAATAAINKLVEGEEADEVGASGHAASRRRGRSIGHASSSHYPSPTTRSHQLLLLGTALRLPSLRREPR